MSRRAYCEKHTSVHMGNTVWKLLDDKAGSITGPPFLTGFQSKNLRGTPPQGKKLKGEANTRCKRAEVGQEVQTDS
jgi:hypothetical protein